MMCNKNGKRLQNHYQLNDEINTPKKTSCVKNSILEWGTEQKADQYHSFKKSSIIEKCY